MLKNNLLRHKTLSACMLCALAAQAQTDVTNTYFANPSFEADAAACATVGSGDFRGWDVTPAGWTMSTAGVVAKIISNDCNTDNNFGKPGTMNDGAYAFYLRMGWSTGSSSMQQTSAQELPVGRYKLTIFQKNAYANSATSSALASVIGTDGKQLGKTAVPFGAGATDCFKAMDWTPTVVWFDVEAPQKVKLLIDVTWASGGSCIMVDNICLQQYPAGYVEETVIGGTEDQVTSPTEGVINNAFVAEAQMKDDLLQMLADFTVYVKNDFQDCSAPNSVGEVCGCFKGENTMGNNEQGVRPNADLSMVCAFLCKYAKGKVTLPASVTWDDLEKMAMKSLVFAYSTHKANKLKVCSGGNYWGSLSTSDCVWESSLWAMSVAYSAFFQYDKLTDAQKNYIYKLVKAECNYELQRGIPTGYAGDTKAEENGWETNILACALGLYPNDVLADKWFARLREFAINCYSQMNDAQNNTVIDPWYDTKTVKDLYKGQNLYDDFTLQNHNFFHTSYQNVVMQELGESALALKLFQMGLNGKEQWKTNALMHNNQQVMDLVMNQLALADGELAMPNGNDWSLFLYDQITSYTTMACFAKDANALLLENLAYKNIKARQKTTADGSWLLRADVGARRMGVEAHRVMMTWLMHEAMSTADVQPVEWESFRQQYAAAKVFDSQNIVRANTKDRFTCFSWSTGKSSYTGYFTQNCPDKNKIVVPFRANNTGNLLGWYMVSGKATDAQPVVNGVYKLKGDSYTMNGALKTNGGALTNHFAFYSTPGNAFIYLDAVKANTAATVTGERGGLLAISTDELTKLKRTIYYQNGRRQVDGASMQEFNSEWANIDNEIGVVAPGNKGMAFGEKANNNSINTSKFYPLYCNESRSVASGAEVDRRQLVYYSSVDAATTQQMLEQTVDLKDAVPAGWNGVIAADPDGTRYVFVANFTGQEQADVVLPAMKQGAPVLSVSTHVNGGKSTAHYNLSPDKSVGDVLRFFVTSGTIDACQATDSISAYLTNAAAEDAYVGVRILTNGDEVTGQVKVPAGERVLVSVDADGQLSTKAAPLPNKNVTALFVRNAGFDESPVTYGVNGKRHADAVDKWAGMGYTSAYAYNVTGWNNASEVTSNSTFSATFALGSSKDFNTSIVPAQGADGVTDGACLGISSGWGTSNFVQYTQTVSLPAADYVLEYDTYNALPSATNIIKNLFGFQGDGISQYGEDMYLKPSVWQTHAVEVQLTAPFEGELSVGASCSSAGSGAGPRFFVDGVRLYTSLPLETVEAYAWEQAQQKVKAALEALPEMKSGACYEALLQAMAATYNTYDECVTAVWTLNDAVEQFVLNARQVEMVVSQEGWTTLMLPFDAELPEGCKAFTCTSLKADGMTLQLDAASSLKANTPYIIQGAEGTYPFKGSAPVVDGEQTEGLLSGRSAATQVPAGTYVLQTRSENGTAFYCVAENEKVNLGAWQVCIVAPSEQPLYFIEGVTAIQSVDADEVSSAVYRLDGTRLSTKKGKLQKGVYIINGQTKMMK